MTFPDYILADDFSGAHDVGLPFAAHGFRTAVLTSADHLPSVAGTADIVVLDTDSRDCDAEAARRRVEAACRAIVGHDGRLLYKKIDSTLRGHVGQELDAVRSILGHAVTLVAPAFPELGRATVGGYHLIDGIPVHRTAAGDDPGSPVQTAKISDLLRPQSGQPVRHIELETVMRGADAVRDAIEDIGQSGDAIIAVDAAAAEDLAAIVAAAYAMPVPPFLCGSAGLARHLAARLAGQHPGKETPPPQSVSGPALLIAGSVHPVTMRQIEAAHSHPGVTVLRLDAFALLAADAASQEIDRVVGAAVDGLTADRDVVVALAPSGDIDRREWLDRLQRAAEGCNLVAELADHLGVICCRIVDLHPPAGLVVTGGETAAYVVRHLQAQGTRITGRVTDGVTMATLLGGPYQDMPLVVKPGGFGGADGLTASIRALRPAGAARVGPDQRPILGITIGDPNGVGPEVIAKALALPEMYEICRPLVVGHAGVMARDCKFASAPLDIRAVSSPTDARFQPGAIDVISVMDLDVDDLVYGEVNATAGRLAVESVIAAAKLAMDGVTQGVVTAPLNKEAMRLAGYRYAGHTELLAELTGTKEFRLTLAFDDMLVSHVTTHVSLRAAIAQLSQEGVIATIEIVGHALKRMGHDNPRIAVAGLNPHAGENGMFGDEEIRIITPAIETARADGWRILGPLPPDTVFLRAQRGEFDGIVGMYHDQGHIPVKAIAFDRTVNVSLGMPIIRTSVDHGTAFDIAGKGVASHENLIAAIRMAVRLIGMKNED